MRHKIMAESSIPKYLLTTDLMWKLISRDMEFQAILMEEIRLVFMTIVKYGKA